MMISLRVASAVAASLAVASIGIKAKAVSLADPRDDTARYLRALADRIDQVGFSEVSIDPKGFVTASKDSCRIKVRDYSPYGSQRISIERLGASYGPTVYAYDGRWFSDPPKLEPLTAYYVQRELGRLSIRLPRKSIVALSMATSCRPFGAGWSKIDIWHQTSGASDGGRL